MKPTRKRNKAQKSTGLIVFWLYAASTLMISLAFFWLRITTGSDGARQEPGQQGISPAGLEILTITDRESALLDGDIVIKVDGKSLDDWLKNIFSSGSREPGWQIGSRIDYSIIRSGSELTIPVRLIKYPIREVLFRNWSTLLFVVISQLVISVVYILNPREAATRVLFVWAWSLSHTYAWSLGLQVSDFTNSLSFVLYQAATGFLWFVFWGAFLHFSLVFPHTHALVKRFRSLPIWAYILPFLISIIYMLLAGKPANSLDMLRNFTVSEWVVGAIITLLWVVILFEGYLKRFSYTERKKTRWIFLSGLICSSLGFLFYLIPASFFNQSIISGPMLGLVLIPFPICLAISVFKDQLFDIDIIIRKTLLYTTLTIILGMAYFGGIVLIQNLFSLATGQSNRLAIVISTVGIASLANPLRKWIQKEIDRRFYRVRYNTEKALAAFISGAREEVNLTQLSSQLSVIVFDSLQPMYLSIWLKKSEHEKSELEKAWHMLLDEEEKGGHNV